MANHPALAFALHVVTDGTSITVSADATTGPFGYQPPGTTPLLNGTVSAIPSAVTNLSCSTGQTVTASILLGVVTFTFSAAPAAGTSDIYGTFEY